MVVPPGAPGSRIDVEVRCVCPPPPILKLMKFFSIVKASLSIRPVPMSPGLPCGSRKLLTSPAPSNPTTGDWKPMAPEAGPDPKADPSTVQPS